MAGRRRSKKHDGQSLFTVLIIACFITLVCCAVITGKVTGTWLAMTLGKATVPRLLSQKRVMPRAGEITVQTLRPFSQRPNAPRE